MGGKGNHRCEGGNTVVSSVLPFPFILHLKKHLDSQKFHDDEEPINKVTMWLHAQAVEFYGIGIQKLVPG